jgi:tetratricopeptide (TPR) repeat protein
MTTATAPRQRLARLEGYLREDPGNTGLLAEVANAAIAGGALDRASELLGLVADDPAPQFAHLRGLLQLARHEFSDAALTFDALLHAQGDIAGVRFNLGYALFRLGELPRATAVFQALVARADAPPESLAYLMRCLHHAGTPALALDAWRAASPALRTLSAVGVASLACLDSNQSDVALTLSEEALRAESPPLEALVTRATLAVGQGSTSLAGALLEQARQRAPDEGRIWSAMGAAWLLQGDVGAADQAFRRATELLPEHVGGWVSLSWCQILLKNLDGARASLEAALALDRNFSETHGGLGVIAALQGLRGEAEAAIERALRLDRASLSARYAEAVLNGQAADVSAIQALARRLLRGRSGGDGVALLDRVLGGLPGRTG